VSSAENAAQLDPVFATLTLLFVGVVLVEIGLLARRRFAGHSVPDYAGWTPAQIHADLRFRLVLGLTLAAAWASIAISFIRRALDLHGLGLLASHLGPFPIPAWLALMLQNGHRLGLTYGRWATGLWLDRAISKRWSQPRPDTTPGGQSLLAFLLALMAIGFSLLD
jgi:hypothetical protein